MVSIAIPSGCFPPHAGAVLARALPFHACPSCGEALAIAPLTDDLLYSDDGWVRGRVPARGA